MESDNAALKQLLSKLEKDLKVAQTQVAQAKVAIKTLQDICPHQWEYQGHSHNDDYFVCSICKKDMWK